MKLSRIDQIALNGGDGLHYKYEDVAEKLIGLCSDFDYQHTYEDRVNMLVKLLVENFPDDAT